LALNWRDPRNPEAGGAEVHLHEILRRAVSAGHPVTQVSHAVDGLPGEEFIDGIRVLRHGRRNTFNFTIRGFCSKLEMARSFDLVIEDLCKVPLYSPLWSPVPVLVAVPHLFGTTAFREVSWPLALYVTLMESRIPSSYRGAKFVAISDSTLHDLIRRGIPGDDISVVPCGIDTGFYTPGGAAPERGTFLYVGRLKRYKGVQHILAALAALRAAGRDYRLRVLGSGDYRTELERTAGRLGLHDSVTFEGFVPPARKLELLRGSWAAVFPSEKEGWGLTVIEANACGTPVIASNSDGLRDSVIDGTTGILVPHADIEALAEAMGRMATEPGLRNALADGGLRWAARFDWDETAHRMLCIMEETAARKGCLIPAESQ
jgi:glycosyltransferase involved in cell wall biosynthesis